jgi:hypothetical protein
MPKAAPLLNSFSSGELSPLFGARVELEEYASGCSRLENFMPLIEGPAERRGGTRFVREVKDMTDRTGTLRFEFNIEQAYILEVGDQYLRFYTDHGIVMNGSAPLEVATPWVAADLFDADGNFLLRSVQSGDVLYITHVDETYPVQKLTRTGALAWTLAEFVPDGGPFVDLDPDETVTVYAGANTGASVTLTASTAGTFTADDIGTLFYLEQKLADTTASWEASKAVNANDVRRAGNRNYKALNSATTGTVQPSHTSGAIFDGNAGVQWEFLDSGYGHGKITAVASGGASATITVQSRIPDGAVGSGDASTRWARGAWSDARGWPSHVTFFRERLVFARASTRELWFSQSGDFENFRDKDTGGDVTKDAGLTIEVTSDQVNRIEWVAPSGSLLVGTAGGEFSIREITTTEAFGPGNAKSKPESSYGSRSVQPARVGDSVLFVQRSGRKMRDIAYTLETEGYRSTNLSVLARHLLPKGKAIISIAYQQEPNSIVWVLRSDGLLFATTLNVNQRRFGWHRHPIGGDGIVEAIEVIPNPATDADELWMIVRRTINGGTVRYVEYMEPPLDAEEDIINAFYVDSGLTYDGSVAQTLTPGTGATVVDTEAVAFTAGGTAFVSGDIGKEIRYRYQDSADVYHTARAEITAVNSGTVVHATIISAWPSLTAIASGGWAITASTISGLDHLEGETLDVLADGSPHSAVVVASGSVTLDSPSWYVHLGLPCPAKIKTMRLEGGSANGTSQGKTKRIDTGMVRLINTVGGKVGPDEDNLDEILFRGPDDLMDEPIPPFTGDKDIAWPDGYTTDAYQMYVNDQPLPATVVGFMPIVDTQAR